MNALPDGEEEYTFCHRITICPEWLRNRSVSEPIIEYLGQRFTWADLFEFATNVGLVVMGWTVLYFLLGDTMLPTNDGFGLYVLALFSHWLGTTLSMIPYVNIPPVFGMLIAGLIVRNSGLYNIQEDLGVATTSKIRTFCLTFIMIRAGLQLSTTSLKTHPYFILALAVVPCTVEMLVVSLCCKYILNYNWDLSFMTGAILGCMSPVVTVNCVLALAEQGYGEDRGLASILCTAACIDDVHIVSIFAIFYSIAFANGESTLPHWSYVLIGLRDSILGIVTGTVLGICFIFFPHRSYKYVIWYRMICLVLGSLMCTTGTAKYIVSGAGFLASLLVSFVSMIGWRILSDSFDAAPFRRVSYNLWRLVQPILVGVIGADIDLDDLAWSRFGSHLTCILLGLMVRSLAAYLTTVRTSLTLKERLFVIVCWLPKGTLQAALGPMAYERLRRTGQSDKELEMAIDIVKISVVTILLLAPIGATLIMISGPLLLEQTPDEQQRRERELSYLRMLSLMPTPNPTAKKPLRAS